MPNHPDRVWRLEGVSNFRDLGGYPGQDGRHVHWRKLFRSEHLGGLTTADRERLAALGLTRSFDFRGVRERAAVPYELSGLAQHSLSIEPSVAQRMDELAASGQDLTTDDMARLMKDLYRGLVNDHAGRFAELFEHLLQDDAPAVFHCTAGKDRTGLAAALLLSALGVSPQLIRRDYLLTNDHFRHPRLPPSSTPPEVLAVLWRVQEGFLDAALEVINRDHGGMGRYLTQRIGLTKAALRDLQAKYLAPA
jgi:protein-tyrosine phosphatase